MESKIAKSTISILKTMVRTLASAVVGFIIGLFVTKDFIAFIIAFGALIITTIILLIIYNYKEKELSLIKIIEEDEKEEDWAEIIKLAFPLSRPLLQSDRHKLRTDLGQRVFRATTKLDSEILINGISVIQIKTSIQIDDIGWSLYKIDPKNNYDSAIANIMSGVESANNIQDKKTSFDYIQKGYRHILSIYLQRNDIEKINEYKDKIDQLLSGEIFINLSQKEKNKILAGIYYVYGYCNILFAKQAKLDEEHIKYLESAKQNAVLAENIYRNLNDFDRICKMYSLFGEIELEYKTFQNYISAIKFFRDGMGQCAKYIRRDFFAQLALLYLDTIEKMISLKQGYKTQIKTFIDEAEIIKHELKTENTHQEQKYIKRLKKIRKIFIKEAKNYGNGGCL